ncbi:MAG: hypothetical protein ACI83P_001375 [Janthinobacterium sp.]
MSTGGGEVMNSAAARLVKILNYPLDIDKLQVGANRVFKSMDAHLASREFLELGRPTIGDLACFSVHGDGRRGRHRLERLSGYPEMNRADEENSWLHPDARHSGSSVKLAGLEQFFQLFFDTGHPLTRVLIGTRWLGCRLKR